MSRRVLVIFKICYRMFWLPQHIWISGVIMKSEVWLMWVCRFFTRHNPMTLFLLKRTIRNVKRLMSKGEHFFNSKGEVSPPTQTFLVPEILQDTEIFVVVGLKLLGESFRCTLLETNFTLSWIFGFNFGSFAIFYKNGHL